MTVRYIVGDTRAATATIPDGTVSLVACSPPFIALRSYLPDDHPDKHLEIGSEPDPATFLQTLLELTAEWGRVLAPWGSIAIELGDTYAGSGGAGGDYGETGWRANQDKYAGAAKHERTHRPEIGPPIRGFPTRAQGGGTGWPRAKSLALIPQLYATSLAYGRNLLTGQPSPAGQWLVRNEIVWHRPNPAVGALGDKVRPSTSYICVATRSPKRWYDLDAVRTEHATEDSRGKVPYPRQMKGRLGTDGENAASAATNNPAGAPPLDCWFDHDDHDVWTLTTQPSKLAHYAMWPAKLAERLILMMCPAEVCTACGEPRRRITRTTNAIGEAVGRRSWRADTNGQHTGDITRSISSAPTAERETLGWTDCGHGTYTPGTVLDPFAGTFTTGAVAEFHGRDAIGIDIDERNRDLYQARRLEVARALNPSAPTELPGQANLFGEMVG